MKSREDQRAADGTKYTLRWWAELPAEVLLEVLEN